MYTIGTIHSGPNGQQVAVDGTIYLVDESPSGDLWAQLGVPASQWSGPGDSRIGPDSPKLYVTGAQKGTLVNGSPATAAVTALRGSLFGIPVWLLIVAALVVYAHRSGRIALSPGVQLGTLLAGTALAVYAWSRFVDD